MWRKVRGWEGKGKGRGREVRDELSVIKFEMGNSHSIFGGNLKDSDTLYLMSNRKCIDSLGDWWSENGWQESLFVGFC